MVRRKQAAKSVLVVDDDYGIREMLTEALVDVGFTVVTAENGERALGWLRQTATLPTVILLDLMMPVMTGWEFRLEQRADPRLAQIPVVMLSARPSSQHETYAIGADAFMQKPLDLTRLLDVVGAYE